MELKINSKIIRDLKPCQDRLDNFTKHYPSNRNYTLKQFLNLENITHYDKLWVVLRLMDNDTKIIFALDCAFSAADAAAYAANANAYAAAYAAYAAYAAANANANANAYAAADAALKAEQDRQLQSLIYLMEGL